jgi:curved DNA-binding protein CbpA
MAEQTRRRAERTPYEVLHVNPAATPEAIRASYRFLARLCHPDLNGDPEADARMRELNAAYAVLNDSGRRARYDADQAWERRERFKRRYVPPNSGTSNNRNGVAHQLGSREPVRVNNRARLRLALLIIILFGLLIISFWLFLELLIDSAWLSFLA